MCSWVYVYHNMQYLALLFVLFCFVSARKLFISITINSDGWLPHKSVKNANIT